MNRIDRIINNKCYIKCMAEIKTLEAARRFCGHGMEHCLDVARIMMILNYEEQADLSRELIYAAALLHDIGRGMEYKTGISHEQAGISTARDILKACGFSQEETGLLIEAIRSHRDASIREERTLSGLLYRADKLSRACYACEAEPACDWDISKKNMQIQY
ncbi:MAG: HD domain-containing protein [bacterium]|nr:HD domain-containing protein [bacterium]